MKNKKRILISIVTVAIMSIILFVVFKENDDNITNLGEKGVLVLSVNPEIQIEYNKDGKVTNVIGKNEDGKKIVESYTDYVGKDCSTVLEELVVEINNAGYFIEDIDGNKKNIIIQIEPGSVVPSETFLEDVGESTQNAVKNLEMTSDIVTIDDDDYDKKYEKENKPSKYITLEKAKEIALAQAKVDEADAVFEDKEFDFDDGVAVYELEFRANGNEYEYDIDALTGKVIKAEHEVINIQNNNVNDSNNNNVNDSNNNNANDSNNNNANDNDDTQNIEYITVEKAKEIALNHAKVNASDAKIVKAELDKDDGVASYEIEFRVGNKEYEYDIDATSGKVIKAEKDVDDDRYDRDDADDNDDDDDDD